jgi:hypothetical protein
MIKRIHYSSPQCEFEKALILDLICTSPEAGESEDLVYEEW